MKAVPVKVVGEPGSYRLMRGGKPFFVKGAGGVKLADLLPKYGGNATRSWGLETAKEDLETCRKAGLVLQMGIWLPHKQDAPDYGDPKLIEELKGRVREAVLIGKNHPNLLAYGLGNEMETGGREADPTLWKTIGELAALLKRLDPNHPVVTVVAELPPGKIDAIKKYAPAVDILGVNSYGGAPSLAARLKGMGWTKPYFVTEFGPLGPWEVGKTPWGAAYEPTSTAKSEWYAKSYQGSVLAAPGHCLGSFAFLWGAKQEETRTWFGMFLPETREPVETVETMSALWRGKALPEGRIVKFEASEPSGELTAGATATFRIELASWVKNPKVAWEVRGETAVKSFAGLGEKTLPVFPVPELARLNGAVATFLVPNAPGAYRIYATVRDSSGFAATTNMPFRVK